MASVISSGQLTVLSQPKYGPIGAYGPYGGLYGVDVVEGTVDSWHDYLAKRPGFVDPLVVWESQPSVRKVVDFIARALASTPLKVYRRASDTDRPRVIDHPLVRVLNAPRNRVTAYRFWYEMVADWMIFDRYCVLKTSNLDTSRMLDLTRVQAARVQFGDDGLGNVQTVWVDGRQKLDPAACIFDHGYSPLGANGTTPMRTLGAILQENAESVAYRRGVWQQGARVPSVIQRPATAPQWSPEARARFASGWQRYARSGGSEGGTPILEDGMTLVKADSFSPRDAEDLTGRQLADAEVASAFQIAPELVGARQGTYSNVDAFRQMKYRDSLGPYYVAWEQTLNAMLVPDLDPTGELYIEADLDAKLRGSFDEQAQILSTSVGAPWLLRNEARARQNLPALPEGDSLVTPLNVLMGGQASPRDSGTQNVGKGRGVAFKARAAATYEKRAEQILTGFFTSQRDEVLTALGRKDAGDWWDGERYDKQLSDSLMALSVLVADEIGKQSAAALGYTADDYDTGRTVAFLRAVSDTRAANINATTKAQIDAALASDDGSPEDVFALALASRAPSAASSIVTASSGFGATEAGRQLGGGKAVKTWEAGSNPRASHAAMAGETVGIEEPFSNGLQWPGDGGDADEVAGCNCGVLVTIP